MRVFSTVEGISSSPRVTMAGAKADS